VAELLFVTVFNTHVCRKKLTERQKLKKQFQRGERNAVFKKNYNCVRQTARHVLSYATLIFSRPY